MKGKYTNQQKKLCCADYGNGMTVLQISKKHNIPRSTIYSWLKEIQDKKPITELTWKNYRQQQRKIERLETILNIIRTVECSIHDPLQTRLAVFEKLRGKYSAHIISEALNVPLGTFYNHIFRNKRDNTWYAKRKEDLRIKIQTIYDESHQIFGSAKITAVLKNNGEVVSVNTVRNLMKEMGLESIRKDAKKNYEKEQLRYKNYLHQQFTTSRPNEVWVSDVTYFPLHKEKFYICVIMDLFARRIVGYRIGKRNSTNLTKATFKQAYESRKPDHELLFHTDRGGNYRSVTFCKYLKSLNVKQSFSRAHVPYDNSVVESFFSSMKREELYRTKYRSEKEFRIAIENYIHFYNEQRPHSKNLNKTPVQKELEFFKK